MYISCSCNRGGRGGYPGTKKKENLSLRIKREVRTTIKVEIEMLLLKI